MTNYSHKVRTDLPLVSGSVRPLQQRYATDLYTQVHAEGCRHQNRLEMVHPHSLQEAARYADDFYQVAPCAR